MTVSLVKKSTPVLVVERIEPALGFWQRLGVEKVMEVPEGEGEAARIGFAILAGPGVELMYQTADSVRADLAASASDPSGVRDGARQGVLFVEVANLSLVEERLRGERLVMPFRTTFYGAKELGYDDRAGNFVVFAEMPPA